MSVELDPVYALRALDLSRVGAIGFDLDETLAVHRRELFLDAALPAAVGKLIERGYPAHLAGLPYPRELGRRGLLIDRLKGNVLKTSREGTVECALHGLTPLTGEARSRLYARHGEVRPGLAYFEIETLFATPIAIIFAATVHALEAAGEKVSYHRLLHDVIEAATDVFGGGDGPVSVAVALACERYLHGDEGLARMLAGFRAAGKRVFLLTNSSWSHAERLLSWLLRSAEGPWYRQFDVVVVEAGKPKFFTAADAARAHPSSDEATVILQGGGAAELEARLGSGGDRVLYFGDCIREDVIAPNEHRGWNTALIAPEIEPVLGQPAELESAWAAMFGHHSSRSWFTRQIERHASLLTARASLLAGYPPSHRFQPVAEPATPGSL